jgi:hypothetical protein
MFKANTVHKALQRHTHSASTTVVASECPGEGVLSSSTLLPVTSVQQSHVQQSCRGSALYTLHLLDAQNSPSFQQPPL